MNNDLPKELREALLKITDEGDASADAGWNLLAELIKPRPGVAAEYDHHRAWRRLVIAIMRAGIADEADYLGLRALADRAGH